MAICGGIIQGATYNCDNPIIPGVVPDIILFNLKDVAAITYSTTPGEESIIEDITLATGKQGWLFEGFRQSARPSWEYVKQAFSIAYNHIVDLQVFDITAAQKKNLEAMALAKIVAVVQNLDKTDTVPYEVYGLDVGMEVNTLTRIANDLDTAGSFSLQLMTPDDAGKEPKMPPSWWVTDYATTKVAVDALLTPAP